MNTGIEAGVDAPAAEEKITVTETKVRYRKIKIRENLTIYANPKGSKPLRYVLSDPWNWA